jgi:hypothetical protein
LTKGYQSFILCLTPPRVTRGKEEVRHMGKGLGAVIFAVVVFIVIEILVVTMVTGTSTGDNIVKVIVPIVAALLPIGVILAILMKSFSKG